MHGCDAPGLFAGRVECLPGEADKCRAGTYCNAKNQCTTGCRTDEACKALSELVPFCATDRHQCVACLTSDTCNGQTCSPAGACVQSCDGGKPCPGGQSCCKGLCIDTTKDVLNCGTCDVACGADNGSPKCEDSKCVSECADGFANCSGDPKTGCETSIRTDPNHCGSCTTSCTGLAHVEATVCVAAKCGFTRCQPGYANDDGDPSNGCEKECNADGQFCCANQVCGPGLKCQGSKCRTDNSGSGGG